MVVKDLLVENLQVVGGQLRNSPVSPPANFGFRKKCWYRRVNERFQYESPRKPTLSAVMLLEKT